MPNLTVSCTEYSVKFRRLIQIRQFPVCDPSNSSPSFSVAPDYTMKSVKAAAQFEGIACSVMYFDLLQNFNR